MVAARSEARKAISSATSSADKRLVRALDKYCATVPGYYLYYPSRLNVAPKLKVLIDFLKVSGSKRGRA
jgi:DNA-binding transcriptional LysR family regulator